MQTPLRKLPFIFIEIEQPGDRGDFHITVIDGETRKKITQNRISEERSYLQYLYTARLLESAVAHAQANKPEFEQQLKHRQEDLIRYGQMLYQDLFGQDNTFKQYLAKQPHLKNGAQLILKLHNTASELWNTPWEYIHDGTQFLGIQPQYPILRTLRDIRLERDNLDLRELPCPLRILMVISHPKDASPLNIDTEIAMIRRAVKPAEDAGRIEIDFVEEGSLQNLDKALLDGDYHMLHYSGHGSIAPQGSFLVMEDEQGLARPVFLWELLPLLQRSKNLRFIFLSACKAGTITETKATSGIATGLLQAVPAVLAMQFSILDQRASILAETFYGGLGRGLTLEEAIHSARLALHQENTLADDWGVPVLYTHQPNLRMIDTRAAVAAVRRSQRFELSSLPTSDPFVGRHDEQRIIRSAIPNTTIQSIYVWGMAGIGKSALVRRVIERSGERDLLSDVLALRCDQIELPKIVAQITQWIIRHFPNTASVLNNNKISPVDRIEQIARFVRGKRLILILDGIDHVMEMQEDRHSEFPHPLLTDYFQVLATTEWSILTIFTSRTRWEKLLELPKEHCLEIHLDTLVLSDIVFLLQNLNQLKSAEQETVNKFFQLVGGHPLTMHYINDYLKQNPQRNPLSDPQLPKRLAVWWHKLFLAEVMQRLKPEEREALRLLSVYGEPFDAQYLQLLAKLPSVEAAEQIIVSWELLSLAYFVDTDEEDTPWYIVPSLVQTYITSQIKPEKLATSHAEVARVMQNNFFLNAQARFEDIGGPQPDSKDELRSVLKDIEVMPKRMSAPSAYRYLERVNNWQNHLREAGNAQAANRIVLTMLPPLWTIRYHKLGRELVERLLEKITEKGEDYLVTRFWEATYAMEAGDYDKALTLLQNLEKLARQIKHPKLLPQIMIRQGEVYRGQGNHKEACRLWRGALEMVQRPLDVVVSIQILFLLGETAYFHGEITEASRFTDDALNLLSKTDRINVSLRTVGTLLLYRGHIFRKAQQDVEALKQYGDALEMGEELGDGTLVGKSLESIGYTYGLLGQYDLAARFLLQSIDVYEKIEDKASLAVAQSRLAQVYGYQGNTAEAVVFGERALQLAIQHAPTAIKQTEALVTQLKRKRIR
jgi:CHAT domain-containing protein/tetratricopeptide (TPR) repeat protein